VSINNPYYVNSDLGFRFTARASFGGAVRDKKKKVVVKDLSKICAASMQNPADPDASYRKKNNTPHVGYAAHAPGITASSTCRML